MYFWHQLIMLKQNLQQKLLQKLSPQQIQFIKLLQVPTVSLDTRIKEELEENPALEDLSLTNLNEPEEQYPDRDPEDDNFNSDEEKGEADEVVDELRRLADEVGSVDVLVNNAGTSWFGSTADLDVDTFDRMLAANVRAPYFMVAAIAPAMAANGGGSIINVGSMAGEIGMPGGAAYGGTKGMISAMTRSWAAEFSPQGVRVNTVASGPTYTGIQPREQRVEEAPQRRAVHADRRDGQF